VCCVWLADFLVCRFQTFLQSFHICNDKYPLTMTNSTKINLLLFFATANAASSVLDFETHSNTIQILRKVLLAIGNWGILV
jgi:hypothetical protein